MLPLSLAGSVACHELSLSFQFPIEIVLAKQAWDKLHWA